MTLMALTPIIHITLYSHFPSSGIDFSGNEEGGDKNSVAVPVGAISERQGESLSDHIFFGQIFVTYTPPTYPALGVQAPSL